MRQVWYVHKYYLGEYRGCMRIPDVLEVVDKWSRTMTDRYGDLGWKYVVSGTARDPAQTLQNLMASEGDDPELRSLAMASE